MAKHDADMKTECQAMMAKKKKMQDNLHAMDAALDKLVAEMNAAKGSKEVDALEKTMAAVINELVAQQKASRSVMMEMQSAMMAHMTHHVAMQGTEDAMAPALGVSTAQVQEAPMTRMKTGRAASHAASMTDMMGAPGLLPFEIMTGQAGRWMVGYQFMFDKLDGILDGTNGISEATVLSRFGATPTDMAMRMHMGMIMYAPTDKLTLMAMLPYVEMSMGELHRDGTRSTERSEGIGDLEFRGLYPLYAAKDLRHRILANFGVGFPTGSVNQRDAEGVRMEYPMQTGSGTFSLLPGFTYLGQALPWGWAADVDATVRLGRNDIGYRLGSRYRSSVTIARQLGNSVSVSAGFRGTLWGNIHGSDPLLDPTDEPTKDPSLQGGKRLSGVFGMTVHPEKGLFKGQHLHVLGEMPVVQSLNGPQLQRRWVVRAGWQLEF
ncbi:MAG: hypothetical protein PT977_11075 [Acidobacteriota bacterium]|nr:hypothetical protein [Acidobacteriota bacterium]